MTAPKPPRTTLTASEQVGEDVVRGPDAGEARDSLPRLAGHEDGAGSNRAILADLTPAQLARLWALVVGVLAVVGAFGWGLTRT